MVLQDAFVTRGGYVGGWEGFVAAMRVPCVMGATTTGVAPVRGGGGSRRREGPSPQGGGATAGTGTGRMPRWTPKRERKKAGDTAGGCGRWWAPTAPAPVRAPREARGLGQSMSAMQPAGDGLAQGQRKGSRSARAAREAGIAGAEGGIEEVGREFGMAAAGTAEAAAEAPPRLPPAVAELDFVEAALRLDHQSARNELKRLRMRGAVDVGAEACSRGDAEGRAPLALCVRAAEREVDAYAMTLVLLEGGAAPRGCARDGRTALMEAATRGWTDVAVLLLNYASDPTAEDSDGARASAHAMRAGHSELKSVLEGAEKMWDEINVSASRVP